MYYLLEFKVLEQGYFAERMEVLEDGKVFDQSVLSLLTDGVPLRARNLDITYPKLRGKVGHILDGVFSFTAVSNVIQEVLLNFCKEDRDIELIPVTIKRKTPYTYAFLNVLHSLDAIDTEQSDLTELVPGIKVYNEIQHLVLDPQVIGACHIFRLTSCSTWLFVSTPLKEALEALQLEELDFIPIDKTFKWTMAGGIEGRNWWD